MGDGRHLSGLSIGEPNPNTLFIGIENNATLFSEAEGRITTDNVMLINDDFEYRIRNFRNETLDKVIMILPDPRYVDRHYHDDWISLYSRIFLKLKNLGELEIVTEIIDELLQPVSDATYYTWASWLLKAFVDIGFGVMEIVHGAPVNYSSTCLDRFRQDPERIRLVTLRLYKPRA